MSSDRGYSSAILTPQTSLESVSSFNSRVNLIIFLYFLHYFFWCNELASNGGHEESSTPSLSPCGRRTSSSSGRWRKLRDRLHEATASVKGPAKNKNRFGSLVKLAEKESKKAKRQNVNVEVNSNFLKSGCGRPTKKKIIK